MVGKRTAGRVVTLDIDSAGIRFLEVRGGVIRKWANVALEADNIEDETLSQQALQNTIKQLMALSSSKLGKVTASVSGLYSVSRILPLPAVPAGVTTQEFVQEMAKDVMPLSDDKIYLSWQIIANADSEGEGKVLVIGVPRSMLDNEVKALRAVGVNPRILELKAMALTRVVNREQAVIVNIEPSSFDIVIIVKRVPEIMRSIAWQQDGLTVEDKVEPLAANLELTVDFFNSHNSGTPIDANTPIFFTGQMSGDLDLMDKLQARLGYPAEEITPQLRCPPDLPISQYAVNIGLALRGMEQAGDDGGVGPGLGVNLLPSIYNPWRPTARQIYSFVAVVAAIALLFPLFQITTEVMDETTSLQIKNDALNSQLEIKKVEIKRREPIQKAVNEYHNITKREGSFIADIDVIWNEAAQLDVEVGTISHDGGVIIFSCEAKDFLTFRRYLTVLEESGRFKSPIPPPEMFPYVKGGTIKLEIQTGE
jgi:type IV pilus assembly protein PilM